MLDYCNLFLFTCFCWASEDTYLSHVSCVHVIADVVLGNSYSYGGSDDGTNVRSVSLYL